MQISSRKLGLITDIQFGISSMKSISMILSMVARGDLALEVLTEERLLVCCLVRESERVLNQGASSSRQLILLMVSRGSPATIGLGGTDLPS